MKTTKSVLLIDDDSDEHAWFQDALKTYNSTITCLTAFSCLEGYNLIKNNPPDVIFLDYNLPGTNGLECLKKIKQTRSLKHVTVYMYSASKVQAEAKLALDTGAKEWLVKPNNLMNYGTLFSKVFE